jgi:hypothetical protein
MPPVYDSKHSVLNRSILLQARGAQCHVKELEHDEDCDTVFDRRGGDHGADGAAIEHAQYVVGRGTLRIPSSLAVSTRVGAGVLPMAFRRHSHGCGCYRLVHNRRSCAIRLRKTSIDITITPYSSNSSACCTTVSELALQIPYAKQCVELFSIRLLSALQSRLFLSACELFLLAVARLRAYPC